MAKTSTEPAVSIANFGLGEPITDDNYASVAQGGHYIWERVGTIFLTHAFRPLFKITSTSYTTATTETADYAEPLDILWGSAIALRRIEPGGVVRTGVQITVQGVNVDVRLTVRAQGGATSTTTVASCGATWERATASVNIAPASYDYAGENDMYCYIDAKVPATGTGYVAAVVVAELIASTSDLPRGR
jgi:hypothetical protein